MNFKKKNAANAPAPNQAQQAARRRSLRRYSGEPVPQALLDRILIFPPAKCSP